MRNLKTTIIGAGSTYTPELISGFLERSNCLLFSDIVLMDIDPEKLQIVGGLTKRMLHAAGFNGSITLTTNLDEAIDSADYIFSQIRVGKLPARILDEKIPLQYGTLGQETTGVGGFMNALRTIPVILNICERIERLAPNAWVINFTNPSGIITEAMLSHTHVKTIGLCNCPINMLAAIQNTIGSDSFDYDYVGLNHLSWITSVIVDGHDIVDQLKKTDLGRMKNVPDIPYEDELMEAIPGIPSSYLSYYYLREKQLRSCTQAKQTRGEICVDIESKLLLDYADTRLTVKPSGLSKRGGAMYSTAALSVVDAIENDRNEYHVVNVKNNGALPFLSHDDVVEVKCTLNMHGATPEPITQQQHPYIIGLIQAVKAYEKLTIRAAITGSRKDALSAMMVHPLIGDYEKSRNLLESMLEANKMHLPKYWL